MDNEDGFIYVAMFWCGWGSNARAGHGASQNIQDSECPLDLDGLKSFICKFLSYFSGAGIISHPNQKSCIF